MASAGKQAWPRVLPMPPLPPQRVTTGSSGEVTPPAATPDAEPIPPGEVALGEDVPLPLPRPVRHAARPAKPQTVAAIQNLHGAQ